MPLYLIVILLLVSLYLILLLVATIYQSSANFLIVWRWKIMPSKTYNLFLCKIIDIGNIHVFKDELELELNNNIGIKNKNWYGEIIIDKINKNIVYKIQIKKTYVNDMIALILSRT